MNGKRVLITGVTGFIGGHLVAFLNCYYPSCKITGIARKKINDSYSYDFHAMNLLHQHELTELIEQIRPDYVFHLAGLVFSYDWDALYQSNVMSTLNLLAAIKKSKANSRVVIAGSSAEYGVISRKDLPVTENHPAMPHSPYGMTKLWQTMIAGFDVASTPSVNTARIFNVIGCGTSQQLSTGNLFSQLNRIMQGKQAPKILVGNLHLKRDFLDIEDVCSGLVSIALKGKGRDVYNICSGRSVSLNNILTLSLSAMKLRSLDIIVDTNVMQNTYIEDIYGCNAKIKRDTDWKPFVSLDESIKRALSFSFISAEMV